MSLVPDPSSAASTSLKASGSLNPIENIYRLYEALAATLPLDPVSGLGGKLLYAGEIDPQNSHLLYAANIAGAASLAASPDPAIQRQAIRDGVVDFLVTSLEEALRILKNEIRKHQAVSVAVSVAAETLTAQMLDRGVLPDLLNSGSSPADLQKFLTQGARQIADLPPVIGSFVTWSVDSNFARWLPRLDACAEAILPPHDLVRRRWLRLAPRYLGRLAQRHHSIGLTVEERAHFEAEAGRMLARSQSETGEAAQLKVLAQDFLQ